MTMHKDETAVPEDVLPCPFCGDTRVFWDYSSDGSWQLCCNTIDCQASTLIASTQEQAIARWNRRATHPASGGEVVAWRYRSGLLSGPWLVTTDTFLAKAETRRGNAVEPLYAAPPAEADSVRVEALEEAAQAVERVHLGALGPMTEPSKEPTAVDIAARCAAAIRALSPSTAEAKPDGWRTMESAPKDGRTIPIRFEHINYAVAPLEDKDRWAEVCMAYWTDHNSGGWVWHGIAGKPTAWFDLPLPPNPEKGAGE